MTTRPTDAGRSRVAVNGKVERSQRIDADRFRRLLDGIVIDDTGPFTERLRAWEAACNIVRPHHALGYLTPAEYVASFGPGV
jgi:transposase InsO family protein